MENTTQPKKKKAPKIIFGIIGAILAILGVKSAYFSMTHETTDNAQVEATTIPIVSRLSGYIDSLNVMDFQSVSAGSTIVKIDSEPPPLKRLDLFSGDFVKLWTNTLISGTQS